MQAEGNVSTRHPAHRHHLPLPSSADGKGCEDRMERRNSWMWEDMKRQEFVKEEKNRRQTHGTEAGVMGRVVDTDACWFWFCLIQQIPSVELTHVLHVPGSGKNKHCKVWIMSDFYPVFHLRGGVTHATAEFLASSLIPWLLRDQSKTPGRRPTLVFKSQIRGIFPTQK